MLSHGAIDYQKAAQTNGRSRRIETKGVRHASIHFTDGLIHGGNPHVSPKAAIPIPCIQGYHVHLHSPVQAHFHTKKTLALDRYSQIRSRKEVAGRPPGRRGAENNLNG